MRVCRRCGKIKALIDYTNTVKEEKHEYYCISCGSTETTIHNKEPLEECSHEWHAVAYNDYNSCIKCGARQET